MVDDAHHSRPPRQADIARLANVSQATVSLVINDPEGTTARVGAETRQRVLDAIERLGYVANPAARNLARGRTGLLGVFTFEPVFPADQQDYYYPFLVGIEEEAERRGHDLVLFTSAGSGGRRRLYAGGVNRLKIADGSVLIGHPPDPRELAKLVSEGFPFVCIGRRELSGAGVSYVTCDYVAATMAMIERLAELGHQRIAYVRGGEDREPAVDRERGYRQGIELLGDPATATVVRTSVEAVDAHVVGGLVADGVTAVLAEDDNLAAAVEMGADAHGWRVPDQLSVAVLGDPPSGRADRDWTRFRLPRRELGRTSVELLVERLGTAAGVHHHVVLPCQLEPGSTVGPVDGPIEGPHGGSVSRDGGAASSRQP